MKVLGEGVAYGVVTGEPHPHPVWNCGACGNYLGDARPEYGYEIADWRYCPFCGQSLAPKEGGGR